MPRAGCLGEQRTACTVGPYSQRRSLWEARGGALAGAGRRAGGGCWVGLKFAGRDRLPGLHGLPPVPLHAPPRRRRAPPPAVLRFISFVSVYTHNRWALCRLLFFMGGALDSSPGAIEFRCRPAPPARPHPGLLATTRPPAPASPATRTAPARPPHGAWTAARCGQIPLPAARGWLGASQRARLLMQRGQVPTLLPMPADAYVHVPHTPCCLLSILFCALFPALPACSGNSRQILDRLDLEWKDPDMEVGRQVSTRSACRAGRRQQTRPQGPPAASNARSQPCWACSQPAGTPAPSAACLQVRMRA